MILPTKHLREDRALLTLGAELFVVLREAKTVSRLWSDFSKHRSRGSSPVTYDWFVLTLDLLFALGVVEFARGRVMRTRP
ncbi:MAG: ABC-three component system middle component 6 [Polyangiaceae bacterium]